MDISTANVLQTAGRHAPVAKLPCILLALSTQERELFLPRLGKSPFADATLSLVDCTKLSQGDWEELLGKMRPAILISAWSTLPLPEHGISFLRYICNVTGSVRKVVPRSFIASGGVVTNWGHQAAPQVAEHALLLALSALRNQGCWREYLNKPPRQRGSAISVLQTHTLCGKKVGIHGFGKIARQLIQYLQPFGVEISAYSDGVPPGLVGANGVFPCASLAELFRRSEILFECEALTAQSRNSVTASILSELPDGAVFVNVGRGGTIDECALIQEASSGRLRIALDVAATEPVGPGNPLLDLHGAVLSPHIGGPTLDRLPACGDFALQNITAFLNGHLLESVVTLDIYDRST